MMFIILVHYNCKSGQYPVIYSPIEDTYKVSSDKFHSWDNVGTVLTSDLLPNVIGRILATVDDIKVIEIQTV